MRVNYRHGRTYGIERPPQATAVATSFVNPVERGVFERSNNGIVFG